MKDGMMGHMLAASVLALVHVKEHEKEHEKEFQSVHRLVPQLALLKDFQKALVMEYKLATLKALLKGFHLD